MTKLKNKEGFYARMNTLAQSGKPSVTESRSLGTLIDVKHAADGVAYGIVQENHQYYIKKGGLKTNPNVADFAYIGGLANINEHQYHSLSVADKNRNFLLLTINEALSTKVNKTGSKKVMLTEDKAGEEIEMAAEKVVDLDAATDAAEMAATEPAPEEMPVEPEAGAELGAEAGADDALDADGAGAALPDGGADDLPDGDIEDLPVPDAEGGEEGIEGMEGAEGGEEGIEGMEGAEGGEPEGEEEMSQLQRNVSDVAQEIKDSDLDAGEVKWVVDRFLRAFKPEGDEGEDMFKAVDISDRQELADKILDVVGQDDVESLGDAMPPEEVEEGQEEEGCAECGGFAEYATSRGHDAASMMECDDEEMTNMVSGYANAHDEGQNDGDFKAIALFITPEIIEKLKGDYGHDDFANQVEPFAKEMNEASAEDKMAQVNELFGGLKHLGNKAGQSIKQGAQQFGQNVADKASQVKQAVGQAATDVKQTYHAGEKNAALDKLEKVAQQLGQKIATVNKHAEKSGQEPINVKSILSTISNQVGSAAGTADLGKFRATEEVSEDGSIAVSEPIDGTGIEKPVNETESIAVSEPVDNSGIETLVNEIESIIVSEPIDHTGIEKPVNETPVDHVEVQPNMDEETAEEITAGEEAPEGEEAPIGDEVEVDAELPVDGEVEIDAELPVEEPIEEPIPEPEGDDVGIVAGFDSLGAGVVKPDGAEVTTVEVTKDSVSVTMNESEKKVREYIRQRIMESLGMEKPVLNENKKSETLTKLDRIIQKQLSLHESLSVEEGLGSAISNTMGKLSQGMEGRLKKQRQLKQLLTTLTVQDDAGLNKALMDAFGGDMKFSAGISKYIPNTPAEVKLDVLTQAANDPQGLGKLSVAGQGIGYSPVSHTDAATASGFAKGRSRLGQ